MDYCRVDYYDRTFEYFENDAPVYKYVPFCSQPQIIDYRSEYLMNYYIPYKRIKRIKNMPEDRQINTRYFRTRGGKLMVADNKHG